MRVVREYALQDDVLTCKSTFLPEDDDFDIPFVLVLSCIVGPDGEGPYFNVSTPDSCDFKQVISEIDRFLSTLKIMYL